MSRRVTHLGKATFRTAANICQKRLLTPSFSPGLSGGNSLRCFAYSSAGVGVMRTLEIRPMCGTRSVREPDGSGMYCADQDLEEEILRQPTKSTSFFSSAGVFLADGRQ